jgi:hypothetical protein
VRKTDDLTTILCLCQENLGTLTSWIPLGHSRPVTALLYLNFLDPSGPLQACNGPAFTLVCLHPGKEHVLYIRERTCLELAVWRFILFVFLAAKANKQTVSAIYIIYSTPYVVLRAYLFLYFEFLWTQQLKRKLISSVCPSNCFFCTSNQGAVVIFTSVCITGNENRKLRLS